MTRFRLGPCAATLALALSLSACVVVSKTGDTQGSGGSSSTSTNSSTGSGGEQPDANFLPIPADGTVRVVVEGDGWTGYDRSCGTVVAPDSYHSIGFERAYIQMDTSACTDETSGNSLIQIARAGGLAPGFYDIDPDGNIIGQVGLTPVQYPAVESRVKGRLWIKTAAIEGTDTLLEASFYGTTRFPNSLDDATSEADVVVKTAFRVHLRNIDVP